jgi:hypothetical protein
MVETDKGDCVCISFVVKIKMANKNELEIIAD